MTFPFVGTHSESDWATWSGQNFAVVGDGVTLPTASRLRYVAPEPLFDGSALTAALVDLDVDDDCGDVWLLAADGTVHRYDPDRDDLRRLHCTWDEPPAAPRGIAVTDDTVFIAAGAPPAADEPEAAEPVTAGGPSIATGDAVYYPTEEGADGGESADPEAPAPRDGPGGRIHAFSRHLMQTRWIAESGYADPVALGRHGDAVSVLDRGDADTRPFLATVGGDGAPVSRAAGFRAPVDLAVDDVGDRFVLDRHPEGGAPTVERVAAGGTAVTTAVATDDLVTADGTPLSPDSVAAGRSGELVVGDSTAGEDEHSLFHHRPAAADFDRLTVYTGPAGALLLRRGETTPDPGLYVVGPDRLTLSFLPASERHRRNPDTGRYDAQLVTRLDAGEPEVQWHRVTAELDTSAVGTQVRVAYHATDDADLEFHEPGTEPVTPLERVDGIGPLIAGRLRRAYVQGLGELVRLAPDRVADLASTGSYGVSGRRAAGWIEEARDILDRTGPPDELDWRSVGPPDAEDALLEDAVGRYLWVKLELVGTATEAPLVDSFRAYFPRRSYLRHLPGLYRRDPESAAFLERYLSLFESVFTDVEEEITAATRYLDPDGVPGDALSWLGGWLSLSPDETWSTADERELVRRAPELFKRRGTRRGLRELLGIYLDEPSFPAPWAWAVDRQQAAVEERRAAGELDAEEADRLKALPERKLYLWEPGDLDCIADTDPAVRELYEKLLPCPQCFAVLVWPFVGDDAIREVERIVDATSPAHAVGNVIPLRPSLRLTGEKGETGHNTFLGINTVLADRDFELDEATLGTDSALADREPSGQVGTKHRLGIDTRIS